MVEFTSVEIVRALRCQLPGQNLQDQASQDQTLLANPKRRVSSSASDAVVLEWSGRSVMLLWGAASRAQHLDSPLFEEFRVTDTKPKRSLAAAFFGLVFVVAGGLLLFMSVREFAEVVGTYRWDKVPAQLRSVQVQFPHKVPQWRDREIFELVVRYEYRVGERTYQGDTFRPKPYASHSYQELADRCDQLKLDGISHVYVDPQDPTRAVVERRSLWYGWIVLLPLLFVGIGLAVMLSGLGLFTVASKEPIPKDSREDAVKEIDAGWGTVVLGGIFLLVGLGVLIPLFVRPLLHTQAAKTWERVPCKVIWSRVRIKRGNKGRTYVPEIFYQYQLNGKTHRSNRYSFTTRSSSGRFRKEVLVARFPAGAEAVCFVDPNQPNHAVLELGQGTIGFWWLIPLVFAFVGGALTVSGLRQIRLRHRTLPLRERGN